MADINTNADSLLANGDPPPRSPPQPQRSPTPNGAMVAPGMLMPSYPACDRCHSRKIRCDRKARCQNCIESESACLRTRSVVAGRRQRKSKGKPILEVSKLEDRLARLEKSITQAAPPDLDDDNNVQLTPSNHGSSTDHPSAKRVRGSTAYATRDVQSTLPLSTPMNKAASEPSNFFSSTGAEAQSTIQQALRNATYLCESRQQTLNSALSTIREMLCGNEHDPTARLVQGTFTDSSVIDTDILPSPEFLHEVLGNENTTTELFRWLPAIPQKSFVEWYLDLLQQPPERRDIRKLICISSFFGWYLSDQCFQKGEVTGLGAYLEERAQDYFRVVTAATKQLNVLSSPSILSIQALLCAALRLQELGDQSGCWTLSAAACHMCRALGLNTRTYKDTPEDNEIRWCFINSYVLDQGVAMNLARSPTFHDSNIDPAIFLPRQSELKDVQYKLHYLTVEFGRVQGSIHTDLRSVQGRCDPPSIRFERLQAIKRRLDRLYETITELKANPQLMETSFQVVLNEFSYYNLLTIMYRSVPVLPGEPFLNDECLQAARSTLQLIQPLRDEVSTWQRPVTIVHWSILCYPFTPFFVLFCNVVFNSDVDDLRLMKDLTEYIGKVRDSSPIAAKIYALCATFCDLAQTIFDVEIGKKQQLRQENHAHHADTIYANNHHSLSPVSIGQTSHVNQQMPIPLIQEQRINDFESTGLMNQTQDQADILWRLLLSDPTAQWFETDFSGTMSMTD